MKYNNQKRIMYIKDTQYSTSVHIKLKLYYFAAVVHVFIALHSKLRVAFIIMYIDVC